MKNKKRFWHFFKWFLIFGFVIIFIFEICLFFTKLPFDQLLNHEQGLATFDKRKNLTGLYTNYQGNFFILHAENSLPIIQRGIVAVEDQRFFQHKGVDIFAILRASFQNLVARKRVSGASTITMQLVRMKMNNKRNWWSKIKESWLALKLERVYTKEQILLAYLNNAPFGANIYGIETAALYYFSKRASELNVDETALLLGLPQSPSRFRPDRFLIKANTRKLFVLQRMYEEHLIDANKLRVFSHQLIRLNIHRNAESNQIIPQWLKNNKKQGVVFTSIESVIQNKIEHVVQSYFSKLDLDNDCAIVVVDVSTGKMVAVSEIGGNEKNEFVLGAFSERSTGSCLKPFIYGKAFDLGLAWPEMMVSDMPTSFNGYNPRNNDYQFYKKISVKDALRSSRNIPAVEILNKIGLVKFNILMKDLQLFSENQSNPAGLTSALGGLSFNLMDMTNAYGVFARSGKFIPFTLLADSTAENPIRVFTHETVNKIKSCLIENDEIGFYAKTGTSWGPRDAWCIGYNHLYSVGVWIGHKGGGSQNGITGESTAYPLLTKVFSLLGNEKLNQNNTEGSEMIICNESGFRATRYCSDVRSNIFTGVLRPPLCLIAEHARENSEVQKKFVIVSPAKNASYLLISGSEDLSIACKTNELENQSFWFVNGVFKGEGKEKYLNSLDLQNGENVISSVNDKGQKDVVKIMVKVLP